MTDSTVGHGSNEAVVYERGGTRRLFTVPAVSVIDWGRNLDAISKAAVQVSRDHLDGGETWAECGDLLSQVHPWAHELVIYRSGQRVWEGPIRRPLQSRKGVTLIASDVLGWTERRVVTADRAADVSVLEEAQLALTSAFALDDPGVLAHVTALGSDAATTSVDTKAATTYYSQVLGALVNAGLYFTVVGRRPLLWADSSYVLGTTPILDPARHLIGDIEVAREGDDLATKAWMTNDDGEWATAGGGDLFYGRVERTISAAGIAGTAALTDAANAWRKFRYPAPQTLNIPDGSTLHCDAPFPVALLVPGVLTPVKVTDLAWPVEQTMMLTDVKVHQDKDGEEVAATWAPITGDETSD